MPLSKILGGPKRSSVIISSMNKNATVCCLDLEGVLVPEIWIKVAEKTKIKELRLTTRDIPDYHVLMRRRLNILAKNKIKLADIQKVISKIDPLPQAKTFLNRLHFVL